MYAIVNHLQFIKPVDELIEIVRTSGLPYLISHNGFIDFHFIKMDEFKAIVILLWTDQQAAQDGAKSFGPSWFALHFKPFLAVAENRSTGEVVVSSYTPSSSKTN